jgi:hypothetical protein
MTFSIMCLDHRATGKAAVAVRTGIRPLEHSPSEAAANMAAGALQALGTGYAARQVGGDVTVSRLGVPVLEFFVVEDV